MGSSGTSTPNSDIISTEDDGQFDFEESINTKRNNLSSSKIAADGGLIPLAKTIGSGLTPASKEESKSVSSEGKKKSFLSGIDMFAEELNISAENYSVSILLSTLFYCIQHSLWYTMFDCIQSSIVYSVLLYTVLSYTVLYVYIVLSYTVFYCKRCSMYTVFNFIVFCCIHRVSLSLAETLV